MKSDRQAGQESKGQNQQSQLEITAGLLYQHLQRLLTAQHLAVMRPVILGVLAHRLVEITSGRLRMAKPRPWKLYREVKRLSHQLMQAPARLWWRLTFRHYYDHVLAKKIRKTEGALSAGPDVAIYLIYPNHGLQQSHIHALDEMRAAGVCPIVVANVPLSDNDREQLRTKAFRILERPNEGYDFGGYRDGILSLEAMFPDLQRLWLFNDSIWFVPQPLNWFEQARAMGKDYVAATSSCGLERIDPERFRDISGVFSTNSRRFHYASYALCIGPAILRDPRFFAFWQNYNLTNNKHLTVRRGERGLTRWVVSNGFTHGATFEIDQFASEIKGMSDQEVDRIARELIIFDNAILEKARKDVLQLDPSSEAGRKDRLSLILAVTSRCAPAYALPGYSLRHRGFQFIKKSPLWHEQSSARIQMDILDRLEGAIGDDIRNEAATLLRSPEPTA
ncbi:rhamnan synthesis F family protein [uncultured Roseobacter sp.]|uniref:rhamnan synthesis F family protein n=1 Tax=uncultured Roseobacter sp. TaxID=114847 RepID=UPI0026298E55|nr:rhamnan synthesis F family protein [uncultured Roseobacter sp.]